MKTINQLYTVRANKNRSRIWIEGNRLVHAGFVRGTRYDREVLDDQIILTLNSEGEFKTTGKQDRPLLDICGLFETGDDVSIDYTPNTITINKI